MAAGCWLLAATGVLVVSLSSTQVTIASSEVFSSVSKFSASSGGFCLPQLDPEFLVTPDSGVGDWTSCLIG